MDVIEYFERNYKSLLLCGVMMIKDVDRAQDILHNVAVTLLAKQDELSDLKHPGAYVTQCILCRSYPQKIRSPFRQYISDVYFRKDSKPCIEQNPKPSTMF